MIQFSYTMTGTVRANAVNGLWFISLVFSISAAVNSLLGLTWMQAILYVALIVFGALSLRFVFHSRSPDHRVPWWVLIWIKRSPLVLLVLSVACFFIGLVLFVYASGQVCFSTCIANSTILTLHK